MSTVARRRIAIHHPAVEIQAPDHLPFGKVTSDVAASLQEATGRFAGYFPLPNVAVTSRRHICIASNKESDSTRPPKLPYCVSVLSRLEKSTDHDPIPGRRCRHGHA